MKDFKFKEFCELDNSSEGDFLIHSMDVMLSLDTIQKIKQESVTLLGNITGKTVLEAGCGFANDTHLLSQAVGEKGKVVAIDTSKRMLDEANKRYKENNIDFQLMSVEKIEYPDNYFSAIHADRLLVSHSNYEEIFIELLRVLKTGGKISLTDVDAQTIFISPSTKLTDIVVKEIMNCFVNPTIGRKLSYLFNKFGLNNVYTRTNLSTINDFTTLSKIFNFEKILKTCIDTKQITIEESYKWFSFMLNSSNRKQFLYGVTFFTLSGEKSN